MLHDLWYQLRTVLRRRARLAFGQLDVVKDDCRQAWGLRIESLAQDLRYACRALRKTPGFTVAIILTLGLGIGANTAIFSVVNATLLRPLVAPDAERIVRIRMSDAGRAISGMSPREFEVLRQHAEVFSDIAAHRLELVNVTGGPDPEQIAAGRVSAGFFRLFGMPAIEGRSFTPDEDRPDGRFARWTMSDRSPTQYSSVRRKWGSVWR